ncbi:hypothetical protein DW094_07440 [Ruminococcaceae bacterium AM07-15]|nr:hypothetical protein DW094_07440 [Ruminococcaceae bacterium AM07-15]
MRLPEELQEKAALPGGLSVSKKWQEPLFRVFARACAHTFGAHLSLEKCKNRRTGRRFLQIDKGKGEQFLCAV